MVCEIALDKLLLSFQTFQRVLLLGQRPFELKNHSKIRIEFFLRKNSLKLYGPLLQVYMVLLPVCSIVLPPDVFNLIQNDFVRARLF